MIIYIIFVAYCVRIVFLNEFNFWLRDRRSNIQMLTVTVGLHGLVPGLSHTTNTPETLHSSTTMHKNVGR